MRPSQIHQGQHCRHRRVIFFTLLVVAAAAALPSVSAQGLKFPSLFKRNTENLEEVQQAPCGPGGMTVTPDGDYIISCHQFFDPTYAVLRLNREGIWEPFPNIEMNTPGSGATEILDSVLGIKCDPEGIVWMLDNGRRSQIGPPKLVGWDTDRNKLHKVIPVTPPAILKTSFLCDLALDPEEPFIYISDPASGADAAIIVVDLTTNSARRVLQGENCVIPQSNLMLQLNGKSVQAQSATGEIVQPLAGAGPIATDRKGVWLYFGPTMGSTLYRVKTDFLRNPKLLPNTLKSHVQGYSDKRIGGSIAIDSKGNVYFADVQFGAIGYVTPGEQPRRYKHLLQEDGRLIWPGGLTFGTDGKIHFCNTQLHLTPLYNSGKDASVPPFQIFRIKPHSSNRFWPGN